MNNMQNGSALKTLRILYLAMIAGTIMFSAIFYFTSPGGATAFAGEERTILIVGLFVAAATLSVSSFLWKKDITKIQQESGALPGKFELYRAAAIKRYAFTEFAVIFSLICYFISKEPKLYIVTGILIVYFLTLFPTASKIAMQIGENAEEIERL